MDLKLLTEFSMTKEKGFLTISNAENIEESIVFGCPVVDAELKGATKIQALGATQTYIRRYLYMAAFEIVESDWVDSQAQEEKETADKEKRWKEFISKPDVQEFAKSIDVNLYDNIDRNDFLAKFQESKK